LQVNSGYLKCRLRTPPGLTGSGGRRSDPAERCDAGHRAAALTIWLALIAATKIATGRAARANMARLLNFWMVIGVSSWIELGAEERVR
jgi:hypothetical protein